MDLYDMMTQLNCVKKLDTYDKYILRNENLNFRPNLTIDFHQKSAEMGVGIKKLILQEYNAFNSYYFFSSFSNIYFLNYLKQKKLDYNFLFERH